MNKTHIRDFTQGNISRQLIVFASPLFLSNLLQVVYNMADMIIVGKVLGKAGTSSIAVGGDISAFLTFVAMGFSNAGQVMIAKYIGAKQKERLGRFIGTMSGFLLVCALCVSCLSLSFQNPILRLMNTPPESYSGAVAYSAICMVGLVFIYGYNAVSAILRGMGDSKHPLIFIGVAAVLNVCLDILFVAVLHFGAGGAALATVISQGISFACCVVFLARNHRKFEINIQKQHFIRWDRGMLADYIKLGTPMAIKTASVHVSKLFVNSWINSYGVEVSAFAGIASKISSIANLVSSAMNTAGATMIGQNIAAREFERVKKILIRLTVVALSISLFICFVILLAPDTVFGLFTDDADVLALVGRYLPIAVLLFIGSALRCTMNALINGSGNHIVNFIAAILDGIVFRIGLSALFGLGLSMQYYGFWLGDSLAGFTPFFIGLIFYCTGRWKGKTGSEPTEGSRSG